MTTQSERVIVFQIGLAVLFGLLVAIRWPTEGQVASTGVRSQQMFRLFSYGLMAALLLLLPVFPADKSGERKKERHTRPSAELSNRSMKVTAAAYWPPFR